MESAAFSSPSIVFLTNTCWAAATTVPKAKQLAANCFKREIFSFQN
jgi:hypothetical protein